MKNLHRIIATVAVFAAAMNVTTAWSQAYKPDFTTKVILAGGANDIVNTLTMKLAPNAAGGLIWTMPASNGTAGYVLTTDGSGNLTWAAPTSIVTLSGDVQGASNATSVKAINGVGLGSTTATSGNLLIANGTNWVSTAVNGDATISSAGAINVGKINGSALGSMAGVADKNILIYDAGSSSWKPQAVSSDATISNTGALTLANTAVTAASYGDGTHVGSFTVDAKGRITAASSVLITGAAPTGSAGGDLGGSYPNPTVGKINGVPLGSTTATSGNLLVADGTNWVSVPSSGDVATISTGAMSVNAVHTAAGSSIATAINNNAANAINGENLTHDATLGVNGSHQIGLDLTHANTWSGMQTLGGTALSASSPAQLVANTNDWALSASNSYFYISSSTAVNVTGIAGGVDGRIIVLVNTGSNGITLKNEDAGSTTAGDRFHLAGSSDVILGPDGTATMVYDGTSSNHRWRLVSAQ